MRILAGILVLFMLPTASAFPQGAPDEDAKKKAELREKRAQDLYDGAEKFESEGKFAEAQAKYRELRDRYRITTVCMKNYATIVEKITELGTKLAVTALAKQPMSKKAHVDSWYGYEFLPPADWRGIPPPQQWFGDQDSSERNAAAYLGNPARVTRYTSHFLERLYLQVFKVFEAGGMTQVQTQVIGEYEQRYKGFKEESSSVLRGRYEIPRKVFVSDNGDRVVMYFYFAERRGMALVGVWRAGDGDDFMRFVITTSDGKRILAEPPKTKPVESTDFDSALKIFDQSAKTFSIYDQVTRSGQAVKYDRGARCADWNVMMSSKGSYIIEYATTPEFAKRLGDEMEQIMALYRVVIPSQKGMPKCRVKIFDTEEDFQYYGLVPGAAAYWSPAQEEVVCYRFAGRKVKLDSDEEFELTDDRDPEEVTFKIIYHEGFHQYMYYLMGRDRGVYVPSWLNEGMGDYFFGGNWTKSPRKFAIGLNDWRLKTIHDAVKENKHVPIKQIIRYTQMQYYSKAGLCYAEGWALNYFFLTSEVGRKKGYNMIPSLMFRELIKNGKWQEATTKVFGAYDMDKMELEFKDFVLALPVPGEKK